MTQHFWQVKELNIEKLPTRNRKHNNSSKLYKILTSFVFKFSQTL